MERIEERQIMIEQEKVMCGLISSPGISVFGRK